MSDKQISSEYSHSTSTWREAITITYPVAMGYLPAGMAFGVLASAAGIPGWIALLISILTYSGAAQYAAIPLFATGASLFNISLNTFVINLRHLFYALPLLESLPKNRLKRWYCLFALTDECFSVMTTLPPEKRAGLFLKIALANQAYWVIATLIGILIGGELNELIPHLDFALAALFVILWFEQAQRKRVAWPTFIAIASYLFMLLILPQYALIGALLISVVIILGHAIALGQYKEKL